MAFVANAVSLVTYFFGYMNFSLTKSATTLTNFMGTAFLLALVGGLISDTYLSRFKTCVLFACMELLVSWTNFSCKCISRQKMKRELFSASWIVCKYVIIRFCMHKITVSCTNFKLKKNPIYNKGNFNIILYKISWELDFMDNLKLKFLEKL